MDKDTESKTTPEAGIHSNDLLCRACTPIRGDLYTKPGISLIVKKVDSKKVKVEITSDKEGKRYYEWPLHEYGIMAKRTIDGGAIFKPNNPET